ncbi:hypothetical protein ACA910_017165 [Epithemia clementina (nom. ined.)]
MNSAKACHEIADCPGLYVDAFRTSKYWQQLNVCLILSHYHGDHYGNLPRRYSGPAPIHCTPITAKLLRDIHEIPSEYVIEHEYGETWEYRTCSGRLEGVHDDYVDATERNDASSATQFTSCFITFYDACHCPGAALILIELSLKGGKAYLHTGDMRYHEQMLQYPRLKLAASERRLDTIWLDTTYALATRKHSFPSQIEAIENTALQVKDILSQDDISGNGKDSVDPKRHSCKTLILLCCYNIGKEKLLWRVAQETKRKLYANARKMRMLELCCRNVASAVGEGAHSSSSDDSGDWRDLYDRYCTLNYEETNIHIVPMHLAGRVWPFFQPNYQACAKYAMEHGPAPSPSSGESGKCSFEKVVVFCPTGWAAANNWNRKNSVHVCPKTKFPDGLPTDATSVSSNTIHVEIRLLPYSEHSSITELKRLVDEYWKPRQIIPTVYKTEAEKRQIVELFTVDRNRAKVHFLQSMTHTPSLVNGATNKALWKNEPTSSHNKGIQSRSCHPEQEPVESAQQLTDDTGVDNSNRCREFETAEVPPCDVQTSSNKAMAQHHGEKGGTRDCEAKLLAMGFARSKVNHALESVSKLGQPPTSDGFFDAVLDHLMSEAVVADEKEDDSRNLLKRKRTQQTSLDHFFMRSSPAK